MLLFSIYAINFYFAFVTSATVFSSSQKNCQFQCEERNLAFPLNRGELRWPTPLDQNYSTYVQSCKHGCEDVDERESKCEEKCSEDGIIKLACVQGCRAVLVSFLAHAQELLTQVNANMEIMENFMKLKWKFPDSITSEVKELATADLFWFVQTKPSNSDVGWKWTPLTKGTFNDSIISNEVNIPFDQYEDIEVRLALSFRNQVLVSRKITYHLPLNKSGTKLEIIGQLQLSDDRVAVCYKTNLPVPKYKMTVSTLDDNILNTEESISRCHLFANLPKENCCKVAISAIDENGSITASKEILLDFFVNQIETELLEKSTPKLIFSNGTHLIESDSVDQYSLTENSKIISFPLTTDDSITAISSISDRIIAIGSKKGYLWTFRMFSNETDDTDQQQSTVIQLKTVEESDTPIIQIEIDPIQNFLYAVQHDKGVLRCKLRTLDIEEPSDCILIVFQNPLNPPKQIAIDPINGFIYSLHVDNIIQKSEMIPFNASGIETIQFSQILNDLSPSKGIFYDIRKFLFYSIFQNGSMISLNPISDQIHMITELRFSEVSKFQIKNDEIIWSEQKCDEENSENKICIFSDHFQRNDEEVPKKFTFTSSIFSFTFMDDIFLKPRIKSIESISLLVTDKSARITWTSYSNLPFQAQSKNWRNTTYYLKVTSSESSENQPFEEYTTNTDLTINIVPSITYNAQIQVCSEDFCSTPVSTSNKAMSDLKNNIPFVFTRKKEDDIETLDALGNVIEIDDSVKNLEKIAHPHVLDNTTKTVYLAGDHSMGIFKKQLDDTTGNIKPFKDGLFVEMLSIMPSRSIIFIATSYKIVSYRLPTTFDYEFYSCEESLEDCAEVIGISTDDETGILYFITQSQNGSFTFWEANQNDRNPKQVSTIDRLIPFRRFHVVQDKLILVTKHGNIVQLDRNLSSINIAKNLDQVNQIVPLQYANLLHKIEFTDEIKFKEGSKTTLEWAISPSMEIGTILYKVSIFRENMGNSDAPITTIQLESNYTIPSDVLENWSSAQRFDISIQAITPWQSIILNRTGLFAPVKPPTPPTQLRIFATQQKTVDGPRALISLFWSQPIEWNGTPYQYIVNCTKDDGNIIGGPISASQTHFSFAVKSGKVSCQAAASNEPTNIGKYSEVITIDSSEIRPLVKLFAIDSTNSLISLDDLSHGETKRREIRQVAQPTKVDYQALAFIGEDLYAVRKEGDSAQPVLIQIDTNHIENTVHKVSIGGDVTRIDTMTSDWVGHRLLFVSGSSLYQLPLEPFLSTSLLNPQKLIQLSTATDAKQLAYDPFKNTAYLLTKNGSLFALDLNSKTETNLALKITCLASQTVTWMMTEFTWNRASSPKIYALTWNGLIYVDLTEDYQCNEVRIDWGKFGDRGLKSISSFAIADKLFAFVTSSEMLIYGRETITPIPITNPPLKQILAVSQSSQPYPDRSCFELPSSKEIIFTIVNEGKTGGFLEVTRSISPSICPEVSMPQTQYEIYFTRKNTDKVKHVKSFSDRIHVENGILDKETDYDVTVAWLNRYSPANGVSLAKSFRTGFGYPSAPRDPHAIPVTPDTVFLYWSLPETLNAPISEIKYKISQQAAGLLSPTSIAVIPLSEVVSSNVSSDSAACLINPCRVKIANLRPSNDYKFWVTATHISHLDSTFLKDDDAISSETSARTFDIPGTLRPDNVTGSSLLLRWTGLEPEKKPASISIQYKESGDFHEWQSPSNSSFDSDISTELIMINNLLSATSYDYRFVATYTGTYTIDGKVLAYKEEYYQLIQQARTKAGVPTLPQNVESQIDQDGWILTWKEPMSDGGSPITSYAVETRINKTSEWEIAERGLDGWKQWWRPGKTEIPQTDLEFRIRAANIEGFGPYAYTEERKPIIEEENGNILLYFLILSIALLIFSLIIVLIFWLKSRKVQRLKKREADDERNCISLDVVTNLTFSPMKQLPTEINNELKNLPHVNKEDVRIGSLIDIGTYGKVFEGIAEEIPSSWEKNIKVAVKTLKDDFSYHDKILFMKEAILLNNLDHANIVKMLGVCFVPRSEFLLVEFMEGGNLLDFLRDSIPTENQSSELCLRDLLSIAVDIARGMNYLERLPHVHRGLCAKKCLLSTKESKQRITKLNIGTSKEFESLSNRNDLEASEKVRWMAPEILKSLFFTSKSDVWAFGVLLYEIFSLGEMPYGDKDEHKIVGEVRNGFILSKPSYCPDRLYKLMQQCWAFDLAKRPNFATILKIFETFRERSEFQDDKPLQAQDGHYNVNFDASHDSTSSERGDLREPHSPSHLNKSFGGFENNGFEPSLGNFVGIRKSSKSSTARSLRREKAKSRTNNMDDGDHKNQRPLSYLSVDTISTEYGGERGSLHSPSSSNLNPYLQQMYDTPKSRMSAAPAIGIINDGYESSSNPSLNHSRSLAALPDDTNQGNGLAFQAASTGHLRSQNLSNPRNRPQNGQIPSYEQTRNRNLVSQV